VELLIIVLSLIGSFVLVRIYKKSMSTSTKEQPTPNQPDVKSAVRK